MNQIYLNDWGESGLDGMLDDFGIGKEVINGAEILIASYTYEDYSGSAFVLFRKDGKLFEVNGSHCSCYGLSENDICGGETQWQPEETSLEAIRIRLDASNYGFDGFQEELREILESIESPQS